MIVTATHKKLNETTAHSGISETKITIQKSLFMGGADWARVILYRRGRVVTSYDVENYEITIDHKPTSKFKLQGVQE